MLKIGLTGGIGSGKTTVAKVFENLGVPVFYADQEARKLMESSMDIIQAIKSTFGDNSYIGNKLNPTYLASRVFGNAENLERLNQITHPAVHRQFEQWITRQMKTDYIVEEAALLFESGAYRYFDFMVMVMAPKKLRIDRVMARDHWTESDVLERMNHQLPDEEKIPLSHFLIFNDEQSMLLSQVIPLHEKIISVNSKSSEK